MLTKFRNSRLFIYTQAALAVILWGLSYVWSDQLLVQGIPVEYFVFIRVLFAGGILMVINLATGTEIRINRKDLPKFLLLAMFEPLIYFVCETYGIALTESPTYSAMIIATTPLLALVVGIILFHEKLCFTNVIGFFICLGGILMVTATSSNVGDRFTLGVILLLIAVVAEVGQASCTKWLAGDYKPQVITMYQFILGAIYLSPMFFTKGLAHFDTELYLSASVWRPILFLAILCSCLCFTCWVNAIKHLGVARSAVLQALIPVVTAIAGFLLGREHLNLMQIGGIATASIGVILSQSMSKFKKR
ncbi:MAG: DMT family transporter [Bacteroidales bacterium]|nr:DMT family transporter [Bacteroidales bacterium]